VLSAQDIEDLFGYHPPADETVAQRHQEVRTGCAQLAGHLCEVCPSSYELSLAIDKLREAMHWANASIACPRGVTTN
jgi:hypothetical protein